MWFNGITGNELFSILIGFQNHEIDHLVREVQFQVIDSCGVLWQCRVDFLLGDKGYVGWNKLGAFSQQSPFSVPTLFL